MKPSVASTEEKVFDEHALLREIEKVWGAHGAHAEVYRMLLASRCGPADEAVALLREALREQRRWRSCQNIGACRQCVDDGVTLRIKTFLDALDATEELELKDRHDG